MKHFSFTYILVIGLFSFSCIKNKSEENKQAAKIENQNGKAKVAQTKTTTKNADKVTILIQPFQNFPATSATAIEKELKKIYSGSVKINAPIDFPVNTMNRAKTRYRADALIDYLSKTTKPGFLTIGLTEKDISTTKEKIADWGIFGLGYCPGRSCIASTFRLKGNNKFEKLFKVAIHELGHTQGLDHCPVKTCLMRDAEGKDHLNEEKEFCAKCKSVLVKAGWELK